MDASDVEGQIDRYKEISQIIYEYSPISRPELLKICKKKNLGATKTVDKYTERLREDKKIRVDKHGKKTIYSEPGMPKRSELKKNFKETFGELQKKLKGIETKFPDHPDEIQHQINFMLCRIDNDIKLNLNMWESAYDREIQTDMSGWKMDYKDMCKRLGEMNLKPKFRKEIELCCKKIIVRADKLSHKSFDLTVKRRNMGKSKRRDNISKEIKLLDDHYYNLERCFGEIYSSLIITYNNNDTFNEKGITNIRDALTYADKTLESIS